MAEASRHQRTIARVVTVKIVTRLSEMRALSGLILMTNKNKADQATKLAEKRKNDAQKKLDDPECSQLRGEAGTRINSQIASSDASGEDDASKALTAARMMVAKVLPNLRCALADSWQSAVYISLWRTLGQVARRLRCRGSNWNSLSLQPKEGYCCFCPGASIPLTASRLRVAE